MVRRISLFAVVLAVAAFSHWALGQGIITGSIVGNVTDASGAAVAGAKVSAVNVATNQKFLTETNAAGLFAVRNVPPGPYKVSVTAPSFRQFDMNNVIVTVGKDTTLSNLSLSVGSNSETVTVEGTTPLIEAQAAQISMTFDSKKVTDLPIGRGIDQLALYLPGVATTGSAGRGNNNGGMFSANGQRPRSNNFQIDGQGMTDFSVTGPSIFLVNNDVVAEYQVMTNYDAAYGRNTGSQVNIITKNGTNAFHGSAFEYWRGSRFDSLNHEEQGLQQPTRYVRNTFGGTVGGPIVKDKAWFFGSGAWDRERLEGAPSVDARGRVTPTPNGIAQLGAAFPSSPGVKFLQTFGPAVTAGHPTFSNLQTRNVTVGATTVPVEFGQASRNVGSVSNTRQFTARGDVQLTSKDRIFGRYFLDDEISTNVDEGDGAWGFFEDVPSRGQQLGIDWTRQFSNTLVNQTRFNFTRLNLGFENGTTGCNRGGPTKCPISLAFSDGTLLPMGMASGFPQGRLNRTWEIQDNANKQLARHTIKFGGYFSRQLPTSDFLPNFNGVYTFADFNSLISNTAFRLSMADGDFQIKFPENDFAFYGQDDFRIKPNLTLTLGLRWEWFRNTINRLHDLTVARQQGPNPFWNTALPLDRTTIPAVAEDKNNFGPVIGIAWSPDLKTVVRGGFRIAYDPAFYNIHLNVAGGAPVLNAGILTQGTDPVVPGLPASGFTGADARAVGLPFIPRGVNPGIRSQSRVSNNFHNPYSQQWNLGIQREFSSRMVGEVRYLGNHGVGLFQNLNGNPALNALKNHGLGSFIPAGLTPCTDATQPGGVAGDAGGFSDCARRNVNVRTNTAFNSYHALQSHFDVRAFHGATTTLSYTWSHNIDNASDIYSTLGAGMLNAAQNVFNTGNGERGNSNFDYRHTVGLQIVYEIPFREAQHGLTGKLLGGWQPNITYRYATGQPWTPIENKSHTIDNGPAKGAYSSIFCDPSGTFSTTTDACRPILGNPSAPLDSVGIITSGTPGGTPTVYNLATIHSAAPQLTTLNNVHWIVNNTNAAIFFQNPFLGVGRNILNGQPQHAMNFAMQKNTKINERVTFQLRVTAFNVLNHMFLGVPGSNVSNAGGSFANFNSNLSGGSNPSTLENGLNRRRLEFGGKLVF